jgi:hypothetical protein
VTNLATAVVVDGVEYAAGTAHGTMPAAVVDKIRNPSAWVGGVAPTLSAIPEGKARLDGADLSSATAAKAALGLQVSLFNGHIVPTGTAPTAAAQAAAGTAATATIAGRDTAGAITLTAGSASVASGNQVVVTFNKAFAVAPIVVLAPVTAALGALHPYVAAASTTTFTVGLASAPTVDTAYVINYVVIGK